MAMIEGAEDSARPGYRPEFSRRVQAGCGGQVIELLRSNDAVRLSYVTALLADVGIETVMLDLHNSVLQGSLGILPRRLMVIEADFPAARRHLIDAGEWDGDAA
jgi:hypothetical protein